MKTKTKETPILKQDRITIHYGSQRDGYTFRLAPLSFLWLKEEYPNQNRIDSVFIGFDKRHSIDQIDKSVWEHVMQLLTGFSTDEITQLGGFAVVHPVTHQEIYHSEPVYA